MDTIKTITIPAKDVEVKRESIQVELNADGQITSLFLHTTVGVIKIDEADYATCLTVALHKDINLMLDTYIGADGKILKGEM